MVSDIDLWISHKNAYRWFRDLPSKRTRVEIGRTRGRQLTPRLLGNHSLELASKCTTSLDSVLLFLIYKCAENKQMSFQCCYLNVSIFFSLCFIQLGTIYTLIIRDFLFFRHLQSRHYYFRIRFIIFFLVSLQRYHFDSTVLSTEVSIVVISSPKLKE